VDAALGELRGRRRPRVVDLGTGAGTIALALKHERPGAQVWATDVAGPAVELARENAARLGLEVEVLRGDLFAPLPDDLRGRVDLVVSNPPYVAPASAPALPAEVLADPPEAVFGGPEIYERILPGAAVWLRSGGAAVVEIEEHLGERVAAIARDAGFTEVDVRPDLNARDRVVVGRCA
jgi:release factor glutamine methyltransferase